MKTSFTLALAVMALSAAYSDASGTLGSGAMAATSPSRIDSSAGSVMGPAESSNSTSDGPVKPGAIPTPTIGPNDPDTGGVGGGVAGGFETNATDSASASAGSQNTSASNSQNTSASNASTTAPAATKSGAASYSVAASVFTVVSVASTAAALSW